MAICDAAVGEQNGSKAPAYLTPRIPTHRTRQALDTHTACGLMDAARDDRWEHEPQHEDHRLSPRTSRRSISSSMGSDGSSSLPAIAGATHAVVPTPPPVAAFKSKLKPPSQRVTLLPGKIVTPTTPMMAASPLKLPSLIKPSAPAAVKPVAAGNQESDDEAPTKDSGSSSRSLLSGGPRGSAVDKHRDFIKELEEQKKKEKEKQSKQEMRRRKMQKKLTEKILQEAAMARQKQSEELEPEHCEQPQKEDAEDPQQDDVVQNEEGDEAKRQQEKEAKRQRKRLLKKQQALLEQLQTKKREKQEEEEQGRERDKKRQDKLKKAVLDAIHASKTEEGEEEEEETEPQQVDDIVQESGVASRVSVSPPKSLPEQTEEEGCNDEHQSNQPKPSSAIEKKKHKKYKAAPSRKKPEQDSESEGVEEVIPAVGKGIAAVRQRKDREKQREVAAAGAVIPTEEVVVAPEEKQRAKEQREAVHKKQHEYLQKLADQRRIKQKEEEDAKLLQEKRRRRVQQEAQQRLQEAAAKQQQQRLQDEQDESQHEEEEKKVVVDVDAMVARLSKLKDKDAMVVPEARDFASWKKRHGVATSQKVFSMTGWYPVIKEELEKRGWFCNPEKGSPYFDLKWSLKSDDLKGIKLKEDQYVNHFFQNTSITTKVGLLHNLRSLSWHQSVDIDTVFPRAYDLNEPRDMDAFIMDFRYTFAEGVLKQVVRGVLTAEKKSVRLNEAFVYVLTSIAKKKLRSKREFTSVKTEDSLEESIDDLLSPGAEEIVSELEWEVLSKCQVDAPGKLRASLSYRKRVYADDKDSNVLPGDVGSGPPATGPVVDTVVSALEKKQQKQQDKLKAEAFQREKQRLSELLTRVSVLSSATCDELLALTRGLEAACPQFHLNGGGDLSSASASDQSRNVWIVKPAGLSRGRGIRVFNQLDALLEYADVVNHKECQWVAQKYIENPLLIAKRKFDIRQWVLVTSWDPLTVWVYDDFYLRFSSEEYSMEDLSDQYVHLTNNSIQKNSDKFSNVYATENGELEIEGNMLHSEQFGQYVQQALGVDEEALEATLHSRMKEIVVQSLQCVQDMVQHRKNGCELYGYDFMLDETLRPWLIEVNSSPACDYSTPTAKRYVETGLQGIVQVIVDHREYELRKKSGGGGGGGGGGESEPDTGRWNRIHKAEFVGKPVSSFGADFQIKGTKVQKTRKAAKRMAVVAEEVKAVVEVGAEVEDQEEEEEEETQGIQGIEGEGGEEVEQREEDASGDSEETEDRQESRDEEEESKDDEEEVVASIDSLL